MILKNNIHIYIRKERNDWAKDMRECFALSLRLFCKSGVISEDSCHIPAFLESWTHWIFGGTQESVFLARSLGDSGTQEAWLIPALKSAGVFFHNQRAEAQPLEFLPSFPPLVTDNNQGATNGFANQQHRSSSRFVSEAELALSP